MSQNAALITDAAQAEVQQYLEDCAAGIVAHVSASWEQHAQARIHNVPYVASAVGVGAVANLSLRLQLTESPTTEKVLTVPATYVGVYTPNPEPTVLLHPQSLTVAEGDPYLLSVYAASPTPLAYQWQLNGVDILHANTFDYYVPIAVKSPREALIYTVRLTNAYTALISQAATVTVT